MSRTRDAFHEHLDKCPQCANHPFELCSEGAALLRLASLEPDFAKQSSIVEIAAADKAFRR